MQLTLEQWGGGSTDPQAIENMGTAISASETKEMVHDSAKGRKLKQSGWDQDSTPSSFNSTYCDL